MAADAAVAGGVAPVRTIPAVQAAGVLLVMVAVRVAAPAATVPLTITRVAATAVTAATVAPAVVAPATAPALPPTHRASSTPSLPLLLPQLPGHLLP